MAAYDVADKAKAEELGLSIKEIMTEYAIVPVKGYLPASTTLGNMFGSLFPETGYRHSGAPDFEVCTVYPPQTTR